MEKSPKTLDWANHLLITLPITPDKMPPKPKPPPANKRPPPPPPQHFGSTPDALETLLLSQSQESTPHKHSSSRLLQLPRKLRLLIYRHTHYKHFRDLRSTCKTIANDIDVHLGVSAILDEREDDFEEYFGKIGIRHGRVVNLVSKECLALLNPGLLVELTVGGPISPEYFTYFMSCPNISTLTLNFTQKLLGFKHKSSFFPQASSCLLKLRTLKVTATLKKEKDLVWVCEGVSALLTHLLSTTTTTQKLLHLQISLSYKSPSLLLDLATAQLLVLAQRNSATLQELHLQVRENITSATEADTDTDNRRRSSGTGSSSARRATEMVKSKQSLAKSTTTIAAVATISASSRIINNSTLSGLEKYLSSCKYTFPHLHTATIVVNSHWFPFSQSMLENSHKITHLKLEACDGVLHNCWLNFEAIIKTTSTTLTTVKLFNVSYEDENNNPLSLDFKIFSPCKSLKHLFFSSVKRENIHLPRAKNLKKLPKSLIEVEIWWVTFSAWQFFKLLKNYKAESLRIAYVTRTESSFGWFLFVLRWMIRLKLTKVELVVVTDFKIKFRNKRAALKRLRKAINIQIDYRDHDETFLVVDRRGIRQGSEASIGTIQSG